MKDYRIIIFIAVIALFLLQIFVLKEDSQEETSTKKIVTLSTFVLYDIAQHISEDTFELVKIIPTGVDIHSYEPTPKTMAKVEQSHLVVYNGAGLEPWLTSFDFKNRAVGIGNYIRIRSLDDNEFDTHAHHDHQCAHSTLDPHIWLDIENMKRATDIITYEFIAIQPQYKLRYLENRDKYLKMLVKLDDSYKQKLSMCRLDTIVTSHNAFSYLSRKYNFNVKSLTGLSPDAESSPRDIIRIIEDIKAHNVSVVFFENFTSNKSMKSVAEQANVKLDSLHPIGNITKDDAKNNATYESIMMSNLDKLSEALICQ